MAMDELNVLQSSKELYSKLDTSNQTAFLKLARARYKDITGEENDEAITLPWLLAILLAYNPVTEYIYENEVTRKRDRYAESMIASGNKLAVINRSMSLWMRQTEQFMVFIEDAAVLDGYKKNGVKQVRWVTQKDERTCPTCGPMNGKIYNINKVPPKPHHNCRCYVVPA